MNWREAKKLLKDIRPAKMQSSHENDSFRVHYLKYCEREIKKKLEEFHKIRLRIR